MSTEEEPRLYGTFNSSYNKLILPADKLAELIKILAYAEVIDKSDYKNPKIVPIMESTLEIELVSASRYKEMKIMNLLNQT